MTVIPFPNQPMQHAPRDTAMHRQLFTEMNEEQQTAFLDAIRERRLRTVKVYEEMQAAKRNAKDEKVRTQLQAQASMMDKELLALNKALEKVEARATKVLALRRMLDADTVGEVADEGGIEDEQEGVL